MCHDELITLTAGPIFLISPLVRSMSHTRASYVPFRLRLACIAADEPTLSKERNWARPPTAARAPYCRRRLSKGSRLSLPRLLFLAAGSATSSEAPIPTDLNHGFQRSAGDPEHRLNMNPVLVSLCAALYGRDRRTLAARFSAIYSVFVPLRTRRLGRGLN